MNYCADRFLCQQLQGSSDEFKKEYFIALRRRLFHGLLTAKIVPLPDLTGVLNFRPLHELIRRDACFLSFGQRNVFRYGKDYFLA